MDASGGVVLPVAYDDHGNKLIDFELMAAAGSKQIDTNAVIKRKSEEMAMSILMDFLMLGHQNVGSFALGTAKIDLWTLSVDALARGIAETFNKYAIAPLLRANRMRVDKPPRLVYGEVSNVDLGSLSTFIREMVDAGMLTPSPELETWVREVAKLPAMTEEVEDIDTQERQASRDLAVQ
jgi:phage gp29-like protein